MESMDNSIPSTKNPISLLNPDDRLVLLDGDNLEGPVLDIGLLGGLTELPHRIDGDKDKTFIYSQEACRMIHHPVVGAFEHEVLRCIPLNGLTIKNESVLVLLEGQVTSEQRQSGEDNGQK